MAAPSPTLEALVKDEQRGPVSELVRRLVRELVAEELNGYAGIIGRLDTLEAELARAASDEPSPAASWAHNGTPHRKGADRD